MSTQTSTSSGGYKEDLSIYRKQYAEVTVATQEKDSVPPIIDVIPMHHVNVRLDSILDTLTVMNWPRTIEGFAIQVYTGPSREDANLAKSKVYRLIPEARPKLVFDQPNFKVKVGMFYSRLEAYEIYARLKVGFSNVIIVPERFPINKASK